MKLLSPALVGHPSGEPIDSYNRSHPPTPVRSQGVLLFVLLAGLDALRPLMDGTWMGCG